MSDKPVKRWNKFQLTHSTSELVLKARKAQAATRAHTKTFLFGRLPHVKQVRQSIASWLILVGVLMFIVWIQFWLIQNTYVTNKPESNGTYAEGVIGDIGTLNPLYASSPAEQSLSKLMFSSLFDYDEAGYLRSDLATGYKVSDDGKTYTVTIREDAIWSDGKPIKIEDILFTIKTMKDAGSGAVLGNTWREVDVEKVDNRTLSFKISAPYAPFAHALTFPIIPEHILKNVPVAQIRESDFSTKPVTSGPFTYFNTQYVTAPDGSNRTVVVMERHDGYYRDVPRIKRFQLYSYPDADSLKEGVLSKEINAANNLSLQDVKDVKTKNGFNVSQTDVNAGVYALFNTTSTVLKDKSIRKALQVGTDVDLAISKVSKSLNRLDSPYIPTAEITASAKKPEYDQSKAKSILEENGWVAKNSKTRSKDNVNLSIRVVSLKDPDYEILVSELSKQWTQLGFKVDVEFIDPKNQTQSMTSGILQPRNYDVLIHELTIGADPDVYAYWHSSQATARGLNFTNYSDSMADEYLISARSRDDSKLRSVKYESFYRQWLEDAPAIGLYQSAFTYVRGKSITGFNPDAKLITQVGRYYNVSEWAVRKIDAYTTP